MSGARIKCENVVADSLTSCCGADCARRPHGQRKPRNGEQRDPPSSCQQHERFHEYEGLPLTFAAFTSVTRLPTSLLAASVRQKHHAQRGRVAVGATTITM